MLEARLTAAIKRKFCVIMLATFAMAKKYLPELIVPGGRNGQNVTSILSEPNSFIRGRANHVFETDDHGKVIRDITPERVKIREEHRNLEGKIFERMEKVGRPNPADLEVLRRMGVTK